MAIEWHPALAQWVDIQEVEGKVKYPEPDGNKKNEVSKTKPQLQLIPPAALIGIAEAMENGAAKYGPYNWRGGRVEYMQYLGAILRHTIALIDGEDEAQDSKIHHAKHIGAGAAIIIDALEAGVVVDDRPER